MISYVVAFAMCLSLSLSQELLTVPMTVGDNQYQVRFNPDTDSIASVAKNFCIEQADSLGYTPESPLTDENIGYCVGPIQEYLSNAVTVQRSQQTEAANLLRVKVAFPLHSFTRQSRLLPITRCKSILIPTSMKFALTPPWRRCMLWHATSASNRQIRWATRQRIPSQMQICPSV